MNAQSSIQKFIHLSAWTASIPFSGSSFPYVLVILTNSIRWEDLFSVSILLVISLSFFQGIIFYVKTLKLIIYLPPHGNPHHPPLFHHHILPIFCIALALFSLIVLSIASLSQNSNDVVSVDNHIFSIHSIE